MKRFQAHPVLQGIPFLWAFSLLAATSLLADHWPQFRGPHGQGRAPDSSLPLPFGPDQAVLWQMPMPPGHASPCIWHDTVFLTAYESEQLVTMAVHAKTGEVRWRRSIPPTHIERGHRNGTPANSTPVSDGKRVYVYFGSYGLLAYDFEGNEIWRRPLPVPVTQHGASSSPLLADGRILLQIDQDVQSHLLCVDAEDGEMLWKTPRPGFRRGFSTPIAWPPTQPEWVITSGTLRVMAYDLASGELAWDHGGLPNETVASPAFDAQHLYICGWTMGAGVSHMPAFDTLLELDEDKDEALTRQEASGPARMHFPYIDADKDGRIDRQEWDSISAIFKQSQNALLALKPGPSTQTKPDLAWKHTRGLPYVPSPLAYQGHLYLVKNGGMVTCLKSESGEVVYQEERLGALGDYYASPIAVGGHILVASQRGVVTVFDAGSSALHIRHQVPFEEAIMATPAVAGNRLYLRTANNFYCFGQ